MDPKAQPAGDHWLAQVWDGDRLAWQSSEQYRTEQEAVGEAKKRALDMGRGS